MALKRQVALDTETTGKNDDGTPGDHRIIEIGCVEIIDRKIQNHEFHVLIDPERKVDEEAARVHGMTWEEHLKGKPKFKDICHDFLDFITGAELLIHNAKFDVSFLNNELDLMGYGMHIEDVASVTDTIDVARQNPNIHVFNLDYLCRHFGVNNSRRVQHGALLDAQLLAEVYLAMTGGQVGFDLQVSQAKTAVQHWKRPQGFRLPLMPVEKSRHVLHVNKMIELAQSVKFSSHDEQDFGGSAWGEEYTMPYLAKGKEESKGDYKKRLKEQKAQMIEKLLSPADQEQLKEALQKEQAIFQHWEDRVMGRVPQ